MLASEPPASVRSRPGLGQCHDRLHGAADREAAMQNLDVAANGREAGDTQRTSAVQDRHSAQIDRGDAARNRRSAPLDDLNGVYLPKPGRLELERDIGRARRRAGLWSSRFSTSTA